MDVMVGVLQLAVSLLVVYGGVLCLWHRATDPRIEWGQHRYRGRRHLRLIHELGERPKEPPAAEAQPLPLRKAA